MTAKILDLDDPQVIFDLLQRARAQARAKKARAKPTPNPNIAGRPYKPPVSASWTPPKGPPSRAVPRVGPDTILGQQLAAQAQTIRELEAQIASLKEKGETK